MCLFILTAEHECDSTLSIEGTIQSPNYPNVYPTSVTCRTLIQAPLGQMIWFNITHFSLESDRKQEGVCQYDHDTLRLYDGPDESAPLLGEFCGSLMPEHLHSSDRYLYAVFKSDHAVVSAGFQAQVSFASKQLLLSFVIIIKS